MRYARLLASLILIFIILAVGSQLLRRVLPAVGFPKVTISRSAGAGTRTVGWTHCAPGWPI